MSEFQVSDKVIHPKMQDWGVGKVLEITPDGKARIFFVNVGEKLLGLKHVDLELAEGDPVSNALFDQPGFDELAKDKDYKSLPMAKEDFVRRFPETFHDPEYFKEERDYKFKAHELMLKTLNQEEFGQLVHSCAFDEICQRAKNVVQAVNWAPLLAKFEIMAFNDALKIEQNREKFSLALYRVLYGDDPEKEKFEGYCRCLDEMDAFKWPIATYFQFMAHPDKVMFMKPSIVQNASRLCKYDLDYKPTPNWSTYKSLQEFASYLMKALKAMMLEPRDMIDVQSFMWCISPSKDKQ